MEGYNSPMDDGSMSPSGDQKRRRYTNGGAYAPTPGRSSVGTPYPMLSPYRDTFARWPSALSAGVMGPPPRPPFQHMTPFQQPDLSLTLPPLQTTGEKPVARTDEHVKREELMKKEPYLLMIDNLSRVAPPLRLHQPSPKQTRGTVLAVEGDDAGAVAEVVDYLAKCLVVEHDVRIAQGPRSPVEGQNATLDDYYVLIREWREKNKEIVKFVLSGSDEKRKGSVSVGSSNEADVKNDEDEMVTPTGLTPSVAATSPSQLFSPSTSPLAPNTPTTTTTTTTTTKQPILLLHRYQLYATRTYASRIPIADSYSQWDNWKWIASLWRGIVGPDLTIYVKDVVGSAAPPGAGTPQTPVGSVAPGGPLTDEIKGVEIYAPYRVVVIRRIRTGGGGSGGGKLEESNLRRLGFEVGELLRVRRS